MNIWLIENSVFEALGDLDQITAEVPEARIEAYRGGVSGGTDGQTAVINVRGVLTDNFNFKYAFFGPGNTTYSSIMERLAIAENDSSVDNIQLNISSPGGQASADWLSTMEAIKNSSKKVTARVGQMGASAAYGIAVSAGSITAQNALSSFGSIGVVGTIQKQKNGASVTVTSSNAPDKTVDPETEAGLSKVRAKLDAIESVFIARVAEGRNVSEDVVKSQFGRGGTFLAEDALRLGMIDSISGATANNKGANALQPQNREDSMDLQELLAKHPAVHAEAVALGAKQEKDRVEAHITLGEACGDMSLAVAAIQSGEGLTATHQASYMAAGMNRESVGAREEEEAAAAQVLADAAAAEEASAGGKDVEDQVAEATAQALGLDVGEVE